METTIEKAQTILQAVEVTAFVDEVEWLHRTHGVRFFWLADENPTTIPEVWQQVLEEIIAETGTAPTYVRCDNGPEFTAAALIDGGRIVRSVR